MTALFIDVDSQLDFLYPAGALYAPGAERIVPAITHLNHYAAAHGIPVLSTVDAHAEDDVEFRTWPKHCVAGAFGQRKAAPTLLHRRVVVANREGRIEIDGAEQIVVEKQTVDVFQTHTMAAILAHFNADRFVVYGVVTEICVLNTVRGLLALGKPIHVFPYAIECLTSQGRDMAFAEMAAAGVSISGTDYATS